jgi:hydrogenase maturation factor HypF (carbamoyltransferase family)
MANCIRCGKKFSSVKSIPEYIPGTDIPNTDKIVYEISETGLCRDCCRNIKDILERKDK